MTLHKLRNLLLRLALFSVSFDIMTSTDCFAYSYLTLSQFSQMPVSGYMKMRKFFVQFSWNFTCTNAVIAVFFLTQLTITNHHFIAEISAAPVNKIHQRVEARRRDLNTGSSIKVLGRHRDFEVAVIDKPVYSTRIPGLIEKAWKQHLI